MGTRLESVRTGSPQPVCALWYLRPVGTRDEWNELVGSLGETDRTRSPRFPEFYVLAVRDGAKFLASFRASLGDERIHDLIHDVLADADTILRADTPRALFYTALKRRAISWKRRGDAPVVETPPVEVATEHAHAVEARRAFVLDAQAAFDALPDRERLIVAAAALGEDRETIARDLRTTRANVDQIVSRARKRFREGGP